MKINILLCLLLSGIHYGGISQQLSLRATAGNTALHAAPSLTSNTLKTVEIGQQVGIILEQTPAKQMVTRQGKPVSDYWYKVHFGLHADTVAWVFGRDVTLSSLDYGSMNSAVEPQALENAWIKIAYADATEFIKIDTVPIQWKPAKYRDFIQEPRFILTLNNGSSKEYDRTKRDDWPALIGEFQDLGYYLCSAGEDVSHYFLVNKNNGNELAVQQPFGAQMEVSPDRVVVKMKKTQPVFAPDKKTYLYIDDCEPGGIYAFGFARVDADMVTEMINFDHLYIADFRFIDARSGVAKLENGRYLTIQLK